MTSAISGAHAAHAHQESQPVRQPQPQAQAPKTNPRSEDTVIVKSTGDVENDGESK